MEFFQSKQAAAEFKHAALAKYAPIYANKVGKWSPGHRVHLLDGYAGPGWYDDDSPGSPALLLGTAEALASRRDVRCWFVEEDLGNFNTLRSRLAHLGDHTAELFHGQMATNVPEILRRIDDEPLFALVDPFGIGLPFDCLVNELLGRTTRKPGVKTEVLINFVHAGVYRNAGRLDQVTNDYRQELIAEQVLPQLDANLGGPWWRDVWRQSLPAVRVDNIREAYIDRIRKAAGSGWLYYRLPVSDRPLGPVIYDMLLFTRSLQGLWFFNEAVSLAREEVEGGAHLRPDGPANQGTLFGATDNWVSVIEDNLRQLLSREQRIVVIEQAYEIYGSVLGFARGKHVREAAKSLEKQGLLANPVKGDTDKLILVSKSCQPAALARVSFGI